MAYKYSKERLLEMEYEKLLKHKNDLGDLLAKREEQLDKIKQVFIDIPNEYGSDYDYIGIKIEQILEEIK